MLKCDRLPGLLLCYVTLRLCFRTLRVNGVHVLTLRIFPPFDILIVYACISVRILNEMLLSTQTSCM